MEPWQPPLECYQGDRAAGLSRGYWSCAVNPGLRLMGQPLTSKALEINPKIKSMMAAWIAAIQGMNPGLS